MEMAQMIGQSKAMKAVQALVERVAPHRRHGSGIR